MVLSARRGTAVVVSTVGYTLVPPLLADEVGKRQGILGDIGLAAITADAAVGELFGVAFVDLGGAIASLLANDRADIPLLSAPGLSLAKRDAVRVDHVVGVGHSEEGGGNSQNGRADGRHRDWLLVGNC